MNNSLRQKAVQYFTNEYLDSVRSATTEQIIEYLENFRALQSDLLLPRFPLNQPQPPVQLQSQSLTPPSKLISLKVPPTLLQEFKSKAQSRNIPYQTQIKALMVAWVRSSK